MFFRLMNWLQRQLINLQRIYTLHPKDRERSNIPEKEIVEYINQLIPELSYRGTPPPIAWECPVDAFPATRFKIGDSIQWNDACIYSKHAARKHFGEGPFQVVLVEDYIISLTTNADGHAKVHIPEMLKIIAVGNGKTIIAHPGYFIHYTER